jgi:hypothetical protein
MVSSRIVMSKYMNTYEIGRFPDAHNLNEFLQHIRAEFPNLYLRGLWSLFVDTRVTEAKASQIDWETAAWLSRYG